MAATTPWMGLKVWNLLTDSFDHTQLAENLAKIDQHNHAEGKGVQIPTGGIENGAISASKIGIDAVTDEKILKVAVRGAVTSGGGVSYGSGFSVARSGTSTYTLTFNPALPTAPVVVVSVLGAAGEAGPTGTPTTTEAKIITYNAAGTETAEAFHFIAFPS